MRPGTDQSYRERILRVLLHIQNNLDRDLPLVKLARVAHFSAYHFHRIFKGLVGESVAQHVRRLRLERVAFRLMHTEEAVTPMAFDAGYESHEAFTRAFRKTFGVSPSEFRKRHRRAWRAPAPTGVHFDEVAFEPVAVGAVPEPERIEVDAPARLAVFLRHTGPYLECWPTWTKMLAWAHEHDIDPVDRRAGICHDDPAVTAPDKLRYDACLLLDEPRGNVGVQELFGGTFAVFRHLGPYEDLARLYEEWLGQWLPQSRFEARDTPCVEVYHRTPFETEDPAELLTEVWVPVERRR